MTKSAIIFVKACICFVFLSNPKACFADDQNLPKLSIAQFKDNKSCAVSFTWDDGEKTVYTQAMPIFDEFHYKATLFINPATAAETTIDTDARISWPEIKDASLRGFEIGNHTFSHTNLVLSPTSAEYQINHSFDLIKERTGIAPWSFAFPDDATTEESMAIVKQRHYAIRLGGNLHEVFPKAEHVIYGGRKFTEDVAKEVIDSALSQGKWVIAECHAIRSHRLSYKPLTAELLRSHLSYIKDKENQIWVDTFINVYRYLAQQKDTKIDIKKISAQEVSFSLNSSLDPNVFSFPLTVIINAPSVVKKVSAKQEKNKTAIPVKIEGNNIYVNVAPKGLTHVHWE